MGGVIILVKDAGGLTIARSATVENFANLPSRLMTPPQPSIDYVPGNRSF